MEAVKKSRITETIERYRENGNKTKLYESLLLSKMKLSEVKTVCEYELGSNFNESELRETLENIIPRANGNYDGVCIVEDDE